MYTRFDRRTLYVTYKVVVPANSSAELFVPENHSLGEVKLTNDSQKVNLQKSLAGSYALPADVVYGEKVNVPCKSDQMFAAIDLKSETFS